MQLLCYLAKNNHQVVSRNELLDNVWQGQVVSDDVLNVAISSLRKLLGDSPKEPRYIKTVPRLGYQLIAPLEWLNEPAKQNKQTDQTNDNKHVLTGNSITSSKRNVLVAIVFMALCLLVFFNLNHQSTSSEKIKLAVLPFELLASSDAAEYLADGLTEAIINRLVKEDNIALISRSSSYKFKESKETIGAIAKKLNVDLVLEGSLHIDGENLQVTAQLIDTSTDENLWSEKFQSNLHDIFDLQLEVSNALARRFNKQPVQHQSFNHQPIASDAFTTYLKARYYHNKFDLEQAQTLYQEAILHDGNFAQAYAGIAQVHFLKAFSGGNKTIQYINTAARFANKAYQLAPDNAYANLNMALTHLYLHRAPQKATPFYQRAFALNNQDTMIIEWYITYLLIIEEFEQAKNMIEHMKQVSPLLYNKASLYNSLYYAQDYQGALDELDLISPYMNSSQWVTSASAWIYMAQGKADKLASIAPALFESYQLSQRQIETFQQKLIADGIPSAVSYFLSMIEDQLTKYNQAELLAFAHRYDEALDILEKLERQSQLQVFKLKIEPAFNSLHQHPRFIALVDKLGLLKD